MTRYDLPDVLQVEADGPIRVVRLNRPEQLNATNHELHSGLAALFPQLDADADARVAVITGNGRAFSAGGDFAYIDELAKDAELRPRVADPRPPDRDRHGGVPGADRGRGERAGGRARLQPRGAVRHRLHGRERPPGRPPRAGRPGGRRRRPGHLAAAHQPPAGQGVRADRRPDPGPAGGRDRPGQPRVPDDEVVDQALACARRIAKLPRRAAEDTKRILNMHLERAVLATLDFALTAEDRSFTSPELRANLDRLLSREP